MPPDNNSDPFFSGPPFGAALFDTKRLQTPDHKAADTGVHLLRKAIPAIDRAKPQVYNGNIV